MKEAIGGVSLFQIVIVFLLLFTGVMCLTINHSKAFGVKDEIINIIENTGKDVNNEKNELTKEVKNSIIAYLNEVGYRIDGKCPSGYTGYNRNGTEVTDKASFCIKANSVSDAYHKNIRDICKNAGCKPTSDDFPQMIYYDIVLFYQLDVPVLNDVMNFKLYGSTKVIFG